MKIVVVAVGRVKEAPLRALVDDYLGRVRRYVACEEVELPDGPEAVLLPKLERATQGANVVALEILGKAHGSPEFARGLDALAQRGKGVVAFAIGGADGLPRPFVARAAAAWSLSPLTFPHRLARLVLAEQLYRAMAILRNEPYAH